MSDSEFVEAYRAHNLAQAHVIGLALEEEGHRVLIENESGPHYPPGWVSDPRILVLESELNAAHEIISQIDPGPQTKFRSTMVLTYGPIALLLVGLVALPQTASKIAQIGLMLVVFLGPAIAYARRCFRRSRNPEGSMRCLACESVMAEAETSCPKCGWTFESSISVKD